MVKVILRCFLPLGMALIMPSGVTAIGWPLAPQDSAHPLGNNWGEYQNYGGSGYYHPGIDVISRTPAVPVYAVDHGWVKAWGTTQADLHWRLAISDSPPGVARRCPGWLYAHIDPNRAHKNIGDEVNPGDQIGYLVPWQPSGFAHTHFARISDTGLTWSRFPNPTWLFIQNPLDIIQPNVDSVPPVILNAIAGRRFGICRNNTNTYLEPTSVAGDVDIVVRAYDKTGLTTGDTTWDKLVPYKYIWSVRGSVAAQPRTLGPIFSGVCPPTSAISLVGVTYKQASPCISRGDYDYRDYFVIVTNSDGDSTFEMSDTSGCWHTAAFPDDDYWVKVEVYDAAGNSTVDSMLVHTANGTGIAAGDATADWHHLSIPTVTRVGTPLKLSFELARSMPVRLAVYDAGGRLEYSTAKTEYVAGKHQLQFTPVSAGIHLLVLTTGTNQIVHKLTVLR